MDFKNIEIHNFMSGPIGSHLMQWQKEQMDQMVADVFGFHALQWGLPLFDGLHSNRMPHRWLASSQVRAESDTTANENPIMHLCFDSVAFPFSNDSLDLLVLPHGVDVSRNPVLALQEAYRVLRAEGTIVLSGFVSCNHWRIQSMGDSSSKMTQDDQTFSYWSIRTELDRLGFSQMKVVFCGRKRIREALYFLMKAIRIDKIIPAYYLQSRSVYCLVAVKKVQRVPLLMNPAWDKMPAKAGVSLPMTNRSLPKKIIY
jgi:SAM-dependent methyltransferase